MLRTIRGRGRCVRYGLIIICSSLALGCSDAGPKPPGPPATLAVVSGDAQQATVTHALPDPIEVRVLDANGRGVPGVTVAFEVTSDNGAVSPAQATTDANGDAQTQWTMGTLAATDRALTARVDNVPLGSAPLVATIHAAALAGPAAALAIVTEPAAAARSGVPLFRQPSLLLVDAYGNPVRQAGVIVSALIDNFSVDRLTGTISVPTDSRGVVDFTDLTITGPAGQVQLVFTAPSLSPTTSSSIDVLLD